MASLLPEVYFLSLKQAAVDADHVLVPQGLVDLVPGKAELDLGDAGTITVTRQEELLSGKRLVRNLSRLGNLLQVSRDADRLKVRGLALGEINRAADRDDAGGWVLTGDPSPLLERVWRGEFSPQDSFFLAREISDLSVKPGQMAMLDQGHLGFRQAQDLESGRR